MGNKLSTQLVLQAQQGSAEAFGELYEIYADEMYRYALWYLGVRELAQDAVSDAVCKAFAGIRSLRSAESFKSWLFKILANCCKAGLTEKINARSQTVLEQAENLAAADSCPADRAELWSAVQQLDEKDREILLLSVIGGYTSSEVGDMLSMPAGTVRSRLSRSLARLREALGEAQRQEALVANIE